jgi:cytochrome b pre-mRNA-processing protein 3
MIPPLFRRPKRTIAALYGAIVAQARAPRFYEDYAVPDTVSGRFDMVVLHVVLVVRRLRDGDRRELAQGLFDTFCRDMDHNLREMGISDQGVPRQMQRVGEAFYGRAQAYEAALGQGGEAALGQGGEDALADALLRNVYAGETGSRAAAVALAGYARAAAERLAAQPPVTFEAGVQFPEPARAE